MSASAAREVRRDIRRAFGPAALDTLDRHAEAIAALRNQLATLYEVRANDRVELDQQQKAHAFQLQQHAELITHFACFQQRTFWQRLRWLVTGR